MLGPACEDPWRSHLPDPRNEPKLISVLKSAQAHIQFHILMFHKTKPCELLVHHRKGTCFGYHGPHDQRRVPITYIPLACYKIKVNDQWQVPRGQCDGCDRAHTRPELRYHPALYKTAKCQSYTKTRKCEYGMYCSKAHFQSEMREYGGSYWFGLGKKPWNPSD